MNLGHWIATLSMVASIAAAVFAWRSSRSGKDAVQKAEDANRIAEQTRQDSLAADLQNAWDQVIIALNQLLSVSPCEMTSASRAARSEPGRFC